MRAMFFVFTVSICWKLGNLGHCEETLKMKVKKAIMGHSGKKGKKDANDDRAPGRINPSRDTNPTPHLFANHGYLYFPIPNS